jgi:diguanylate cyclase (GGDEF)-like protein
MGPWRAEPDRLFRVLFSFSGISTRTVVLLGFASVVATGFAEWVTDLPFPNDIVFVLIVGGVTFHGSATAGASLALLAGGIRVISSGAPAVRSPVTWPVATAEGLALIALLLGFVLLARSLHRAIDALQQQAVRDPLTGALNTRGLMDVAERERLRALREGHPLTVACVDIDGLKEVNDGFGHPAGDRLLLEFVEAVMASIRPYDIFARMGGDEFVLILPATDRQAALGAVTRLRRQLAGQQRPLSVSIGVVTYSTSVVSLETMLQAADRLMYQAKQAGGNRLVGNVRSADAGTDQRVELAELTSEPH